MSLDPFWLNTQFMGSITKCTLTIAVTVDGTTASADSFTTRLATLTTLKIAMLST